MLLRTGGILQSVNALAKGVQHDMLCDGIGHHTSCYQLGAAHICPITNESGCSIYPNFCASGLMRLHAQLLQ